MVRDGSLARDVVSTEEQEVSWTKQLQWWVLGNSYVAHVSQRIGRMTAAFSPDDCGS